MSDNLEWLNRHFALLRCGTLNEAVSDEKYECRPDLANFYKKQNVEDIIWDFADAGRYKCAAELMGYVGHHRAVIWWGYQCLLSLYAELKQNPAPVIDIDNIGKSFEPEVPDFAKVEVPKPTPEQIDKVSKIPGQMKEKLQEVRKLCDPDLLEEFEEYMEIFYREFEKVHGIRPIDLLKKMQDIHKQELREGRIDMNSPIFKEAEKIKSQLQAVRQETLDTIHAVIPPELPEVKIKKAQEALEAVYRWVLAPDEINSKRCMEIGNTCPDTPAGILAYCAFWAWGDMMPGNEQYIVVKTPSGLMANGFGKVLMMCALHKGGTRKLKERYEEYFKIGANILNGKNLWDKNAISGEVPHEKVIKVSAEKTRDLPAPVSKVRPKREVELEELERQVTKEKARRSDSELENSKKYTRWKPDQK